MPSTNTRDEGYPHHHDDNHHRTNDNADNADARSSLARFQQPPGRPVMGEGNNHGMMSAVENSSNNAPSRPNTITGGNKHLASTATTTSTSPTSTIETDDEEQEAQHQFSGELLRRSRERRFSVQKELKVKGRHEEEKMEEVSGDCDWNDKNDEHGGGGSDDNSREEVERTCVIAIGLPEPNESTPPPTPPVTSLPPPRTEEEAIQQQVSQVVAENIAEEEHNIKTGEKTSILTASLIQGSTIVQRRPSTRHLTANPSVSAAIDDAIKAAIRNQMQGGASPSVKPAPPRVAVAAPASTTRTSATISSDDAIKMAIRNQMQSSSSHQAVPVKSAARVAAFATAPPPPPPTPNTSSDEAIKMAIRSQMQSSSAVLPLVNNNRTNNNNSTTNNNNDAMAEYVAQRSRQEMSKMAAQAGPSLAPAVSHAAAVAPTITTTSAAAATAAATSTTTTTSDDDIKMAIRSQMQRSVAATVTTNNNADAATAAMAAHVAQRSSLEMTKMSQSSGPSLAPATSTALLPTTATTGPSSLATAAGGPSLAPAVEPTARGPSLAPAVEPTLTTTAAPATATSQVLEANVGLVIQPGAYAIDSGMAATNRSRSTMADNDVENPRVVSYQESNENANSAGARNPAWGTAETTVPYIMSSYVAGEARVMELDENAIVVDGAVINIDEDGLENPKDIRKLRMIQGVALCITVGAIALIIGTVVGLNGANKGEEPLGWTQVGSDLLGPKEEPQVFFGQSLAVSVDGSRVAVTAPGVDQELDLNVGEVRVLDAKQVTNGTEWTMTGKVLGDESTQVAESSLAMSSDGKVIIVGRPHSGNGSVHTYKETKTGWEELEPLLAPQQKERVVPDASTWFGYAVDLSSDGTVMAVGAPMMNKYVFIENTGAVQCYQLVNSTWEKMGEDLSGENDNEMLGWSVSLQATPNGYRVAAGGPASDQERGLVRIFDFVDGSWAPSYTINGNNTLNRFGEAVAMSDDGTVLAVGARGNAFDNGQVYVYRHDNNNGGQQWIQDDQVFTGEEPAEGYGASVALSSDGSVLAVGAPQNSESGVDAGRVEVFKNDGTGSWTREGRSIHGNQGEDFGSVVALSLEGKRLVVGAPSTTFDGSIAQAGTVRVFDRDG